MIAPDPAHTRRHTEILHERTLSDGLALLQTCQQVYQEATEVLYGSNTFYFDDAKHHYLTIKIEASAHCRFCLEYRRRLAENLDTSSDWDRCWDMSKNQHFVFLPRCDYIDMSDWLQSIGQRNRALIREMHFHFTSAQFTKVMGTDWQTWNRVVGKPSPVGGDILERALRYLASDLHLSKLSISFKLPTGLLTDEGLRGPKWHGGGNIQLLEMQHAFKDIFLPRSPIKKALCAIKGLKFFNCDYVPGRWLEIKEEGPIIDLMELARTGLAEVQEQMESPTSQDEEKEQAVGAQLCWSEPRINQCVISNQTNEDLEEYFQALTLNRDDDFAASWLKAAQWKKARR